MTDFPNRFVFIAGCFDALHMGHLAILKHAAALGSLIVGINRDSHLAKKGPGRPLRREHDRMKDLIDTGLVTGVIVFDGDSPLDLILRLQPRYIVVGDDYTLDQVVGAKECGEWGGEVVIVPRIPGFSTTELLNAKPLSS